MGWEGRWKSEVRGTCLDIHDSDLAEDFRLRGEAVPALAFVHEADAHALIQNALGEVVSGSKLQLVSLLHHMLFVQNTPFFSIHLDLCDPIWIPLDLQSFWSFSAHLNCTLQQISGGI